MRRGRIIYSAAELAWLKDHSGLPRAELTQKFKTKFGRDDVKVDDIKALCSRKKWKADIDGRFKSGSVSWNKGRKGYCAPGSEKGWFKKGHVPANKQPAGHERVCNKDGYILINIDEPNPWTGGSSHYVHKHRWLWEKKHGPIPDGMCLKSKDGDPTNCDPSNWDLISRAVLARLNKQGLYKLAPPALKPAVITAAKIESKLSALAGSS